MAFDLQDRGFAKLVLPGLLSVALGAFPAPGDARSPHRGDIWVPKDFLIVGSCAVGPWDQTADLVGEISRYAKTRWKTTPTFKVMFLDLNDGPFARTVTRLDDNQGILIPCGAFWIVSGRGEYLGLLAHETGHVFLRHNDRRREFLTRGRRTETGERIGLDEFERRLEWEAEGFVRDFWIWLKVDNPALAAQMPDYLRLLEDQRASFGPVPRSSDSYPPMLDDRLRFWLAAEGL